MNAQNWARIEQLFSQATSLAGEARTRFLAQLEAPEEVKEQLAELLQHHDEADCFLATPVWQAPQAPAGLLTPGQVVGGRFMIQRLLGRGGMGEVYLVTEGGGKQAALKVLREQFDTSEDGRRRFLREFALARRIAHRNVCRVGELVATDEGWPAFTMEYLQGETLAVQLETAGPFGEAEAELIQAEILAGLEAAHACGVAHRDLKPENVMLLAPGGDRRAVLMDFGLARRVASTVMTAPDTLLGTIDYMAPEQLRGEVAGLAADVYAAALVAHQLRSGKKLFAGPNPAAVLRRLVEAPQLDPVFHGRWARYLEASLDPDPKRRPAVGEARDILLGQRLFLRRGTRRWLFGVAAGLAATAGGAEIWRRTRPAVLPAGLVKVLVMPVANASGDGRLDGAQQMLGDQIRQSAKLDVLGAGEIATGLAYLERKGARLTPALGRAVARRMGATLVVESRIERERGGGLGYGLQVELLSQRPGVAMHTWEFRRESRDAAALPEVVRQGADWIRKVAGEPAAEIAERSLPVAHATTANWDALMLYRRANELKGQGNYLAAEPLFREALALDPEFVSCRLLYADLLTNSYRKAEGATVLRHALAMARRKGISTRERFRVEAATTADDAARMQAYRAWAVQFPNDFYPLYREAGERADRFETEAAVRLYTEALEREEYFGIHAELGNEKMHLGRYGEVGKHIAALERLQRGDQAGILRGRLAYLQGDVTGAIKEFAQVVRTGSTPWRYHARFLEMDAAAEAGQLGRARELAREGRAEQASVSNREWEAQWATAEAILAADTAFAARRIDLRGMAGLAETLEAAVRMGRHPIAVVLAGMAGMRLEAKKEDEAARQVAAGAAALGRGDGVGAHRSLRAATAAGLHYTNTGGELLAITAEAAGRKEEALGHWRRLAEKPSIIWREVAHNWPGLIRLARRRVAVLGGG